MYPALKSCYQNAIAEKMDGFETRKVGGRAPLRLRSPRCRVFGCEIAAAVAAQLRGAEENYLFVKTKETLNKLDMMRIS